MRIFAVMCGIFNVSTICTLIGSSQKRTETKTAWYVCTNWTRTVTTELRSNTVGSSLHQNCWFYPTCRSSQHASQWHSLTSWGTFRTCCFFTQMVCEPHVQPSHCSPHHSGCPPQVQFRSLPCTMSNPSPKIRYLLTSQLGVRTAAACKVQRSKGRSKHGNCVCVSGRLLHMSVMWSARTHTHTHIQLFPSQGRGAEGGVMWLAPDVSVTMAQPHHLLLRPIIPTGCCSTRRTDRFLSALGSWTGRIRGRYMQNVASQNTHTHTHTHTSDEFATRQKIQVPPKRQYLKTFIRHLQVSRDCGISAHQCKKYNE
jgi:hypothetical protein